MKKIISFILLIFTWFSIQAKIPLSVAIRHGIRISFKVQNHFLDEKIKYSEKSTAQRNRLFSINLGSSYFYKSQQVKIEFPATDLGGGVSIPGQTIIAGAKNNYDFVLSLTQPLYLGQVLSTQVKLKGAEIIHSELLTQAEILEVASQIKTSYFNYHLLNSKKKALQTLIKKLNLHRQKLLNFFNEDLIKKSDLLETDSKIREQLLVLEDLKNLIEQEKINFKTLCGLDIDTVTATYREKIIDFSDVLSLFEKENPFLRSLQQKMTTLDLQKKIINGKYLPQIIGFAELHYAKPGIDFFHNLWSFYFQGGVSLSLKLFDWNQKKKDDEIFHYNYQKLNNAKNDFIRYCEKILRQLYLKKQSAEAKLKTLDQLIRISTEDNQLKEELLQQQQIANIDYLASLTTRQQYMAKRDEIQTQIELIKVSINKTIGLSTGYKKENL